MLLLSIFVPMAKNISSKRKGTVIAFLEEVINMNEQEFFLKNCLALKAGGVRMGDRMEIRPLQGRSRHFNLDRTEYSFSTAAKFKIEKPEETEFILPSTPLEKGGRLRIRLVKCYKDEKKADGRYRIENPDKKPFRINGVYTVEAWLMRGQILDFAHNRITFSSPPSLRRTTFLEDIPKKVVEGRISVLLEGETGTGKSHLAKMIHDASGVRGSFVHLNLSAFSPSLIESELFGHVKGAFTGAVRSRRGAFETAHKGTLFLDEIDSLPLEIQTKLLLVLESMLIRPLGGDFTRKVDTRLIFASGRSLLELIAKETFRKDFYFRVQRGFFKQLPSLRERPELLKNIFYNFMEKHNVNGCPRLLKYYLTLKWPGNIRQFVSHLEKKVLLSDGCYLVFDQEDQALEIYPSFKNNKDDMEIMSLAEVKRQYAYEAFRRLEGNLLKTSKLLKVSVPTAKRMIMERKCEVVKNETV